MSGWVKIESVNLDSHSLRGGGTEICLERACFVFKLQLWYFNVAQDLNNI